jgi:hypothetical protein
MLEAEPPRAVSGAPSFDALHKLVVRRSPKSTIDQPHFQKLRDLQRFSGSATHAHTFFSPAIPNP